MGDLKRFGVSVEGDLLRKFDKFIKNHNYNNRSEAIRDLIRKELVNEEWVKSEEKIAGAIVMVYNHHKRELMDNLIDIQHAYQENIISSQHIHLDHDMCLEVVFPVHICNMEKVCILGI